MLPLPVAHQRDPAHAMSTAVHGTAMGRVWAHTFVHNGLVVRGVVLAHDPAQVVDRLARPQDQP